MATAQLKSKLIICNVPTADSEAARKFYGALLGSDRFVPAPTREVESYIQPISPDGVDLRITARQDDRERLTCFFAVENLDEAVETLRGIGAELVVEPKELRTEGDESAGRMAIVLDPDKNAVGLAELDPSSHLYFGLGEHRKPLRDEQLQEFK